MASRTALVLVLLLSALPAVAQPATHRAPPPAPQPFRYTPEEQEACLPDVQKLCDVMQQPAVILACLRRQRDEVSEECRAVLERHPE